eukprot:scaffold80872_cov48-Phaeocystis_antarctica.AAC.1
MGGGGGRHSALAAEVCRELGDEEELPPALGVGGEDVHGRGGVVGPCREGEEQQVRIRPDEQRRLPLSLGPELPQVLQQLELAFARDVGTGHEDGGPRRRGAHARDAAQPRGGVPLERAPQPQHEERAWGDLQRVEARPLLLAVALGCVSLAAPRCRIDAPELLAAQRLRRAGDGRLHVARRLEHLVDPLASGPGPSSAMSTVRRAGKSHSSSSSS